MKFSHSGEIGDCIYVLPLLRALGGKHSIYLVDRVKVPPFSRQITHLERFIGSLLEKQDYIEKVQSTEDEPDFDMSRFRSHHVPTNTLTYAQVSYYNSETGSRITEDGKEPWLKVRGRKSSGKVTIARSSRYNNELFPWEKIIQHYGDRLQFIGLPHEHKAFVKKFGEVEHVKIESLLEMAEVIHDSELFIGNQSSPLAVAIGLGGQIIQEVFIHQPDCIFPRENIQYCYEGRCILPDVSESGVMKIGYDEESDIDFSSIHREMCPPKGWHYPNCPSEPDINNLIRVVMQMDGCDKVTADKAIITYNVARCPEFFQKQYANPNSIVLTSLSNAGVQSQYLLDKAKQTP